MFKTLATLSFGVALAIAISVPAWSQTQKASACEPGKMTCSSWCEKYRMRGEWESCKFFHANSCAKNYGSQEYCVADDKPKR